MSNHLPILLLLASVGGALLAAPAAPQRPTPPFRVLYSNDLTNVPTCDSPYSPAGTPFRREGLEGSVDETARIGVDVHMLQPGTGWVPLWKSDALPFVKHFQWHQERYGVRSPFDAYMLNGGDVVGDFVRRCRKDGLKAFVSLRMNDHHRTDYIDFTKDEALRAGQPQSIYASRWYHDHPEYRLDDRYPIAEKGDLSGAAYRKRYPMQVRVDHLLDWSIEEVRQQKMTLITELCEHYDLDGIELDFVRFPFFFRGETGSDERKAIMTRFVAQVRSILDRTAKPGHPRWLGVRIPSWIEGVGGLESCGLDPKHLAEAGVDIFNLACDYVTEQQSDLGRIRGLIPDAALYKEVSHLVHRYQLPGQRSVYRSTTEEEFYTTAHLAYARGARGVSAFNFVYYRDHEERAPEDVSEPPFHVFNIIRDPEAVARRPQHYFLSRHDARGRPVFGQQLGAHNVYPIVWHATPPATEFAIDLAPPAGGWKQAGRLRIQLDRSWHGAFPNGDEITVRFNGRRLQTTGNVSEPFAVKYTVGLGKTDELRAWIVPVECLNDGINRLELFTPLGCDGRIIFIDLAIK